MAVEDVGTRGWPSWTLEDHLALLDAHDIATSELSISSPGVHFGDDAAARDLARRVNDDGAAIRDARTDRLGHLAFLPLPDVKGAVQKVVRHSLDELGSDGVTVETRAGGRYLGEPAFAPLWAELDAQEAIVFVHPPPPRPPRRSRSAGPARCSSSSSARPVPFATCCSPAC